MSGAIAATDLIMQARAWNNKRRGYLLGYLALAAWSGLARFRSDFWRIAPFLTPGQPGRSRNITAVIPARNEEEHLGACLQALLHQEFYGNFRIIVVDDNSTDGTGRIAQAFVTTHPQVRVLTGKPLPSGWTGKMWAVAQGLADPWAQEAEFVLLTDADILHAPSHLASLVHTADRYNLELVSEMVRLRVDTLAERATVPAFVFFFSMLYPFLAVSDPRRSTAAAAGGTMLVARGALDRVQGVSRIRAELIDDVGLAREIKRGGHRIWLGHAEHAMSLRRYTTFGDVWNMIARTAYVQLGHSPLVLAGTVGGLLLLYTTPVALSVAGRGHSRLLGLASWTVMALLFQPTLRRYERSFLWGPALPAIAMFYLAATLGSAIRYYRGEGGGWKGRVYARLNTAP